MRFDPVDHIVYQSLTRLVVSSHAVSRQFWHTLVIHHATVKLVLRCARPDKPARLPTVKLSLPVNASEMAAGRENCLTHLDSSDLG